MGKPRLLPEESSDPLLSACFAADELVWPGDPRGPRFGDDIWNLAPLVNRPNMTERTLWFGGLDPHWSLAVREVCAFLAQPTHPALLNAGVVWRARPRSLTSIVDTSHHLATIARWSAARGKQRPSELTKRDADQLLAALDAGTHRPGARPVGPARKRAFVTTFRLLDELAPALTGGGLGFVPWPGLTDAKVAGYVLPVENLTAPLPWEVWAPTVAAAWAFVDRFSGDVIAAHNIFTTMPKAPTGGAYGRTAVRIVEEFLDQGGTIPLHTGFARAPFPRGEPNKRLLAIQLGINPSIFNPTHHSYDQLLDQRLELLARDRAKVRFGGVAEAAVLVHLPDGRRVPWASELGRREIEYLVSVLRAACYVLIAALTGMRDSEVQGLASESVTETDGLPALAGRQFKGIGGDHCRPRSWWAPDPVIKAVQVLTRITSLPGKLFALSDRELSAYAPARDIARLLDFVNVDPAERPGRGADLGLPKVPAGRHKVNQQTLRRSFAVYASTHPTAELGLGIQLGHCALRMTSGYYTDGQRSAVEIYNDERRNLAREQVRRVIQGEDRAVGALRTEIDRQFNALIVSNPGQADRIGRQLGDNLHLGVMNDCAYNRSNAPRACADGPALANHKCIAHECSNATWTSAHAPAIRAHLRRLEGFIDGDRIHPDLRSEYQRQRTFYLDVLQEVEKPDA